MSGILFFIFASCHPLNYDVSLFLIGVSTLATYLGQSKLEMKLMCGENKTVTAKKKKKKKKKKGTLRPVGLQKGTK